MISKHSMSTRVRSRARRELAGAFAVAILHLALLMGLTAEIRDRPQPRPASKSPIVERLIVVSLAVPEFRSAALEPVDSPDRPRARSHTVAAPPDPPTASGAGAVSDGLVDGPYALPKTRELAECLGDAQRQSGSFVIAEIVAIEIARCYELHG